MKYCSILIVFLLLSTCNSPQKALEKGSYEKAFQQALKNLTTGKVKTQDLNALEQAFASLITQDQESLKILDAPKNPKNWPAVHETALSIHLRQKDLAPVLSRLKTLGHTPKLTLFPAKKLVDESQEKSALYFYARAQEYIPSARTGNQPAARSAYQWLEKSNGYIRNYKNTAAILKEMYDIATSHILIYPILDLEEESLAGVFFENLLRNKEFPYQTGWQIFHLERPKEHDLSYRLDLSFNDLRATGDETYTDVCFNDIEIENGYTERQEWSVQDSAWIDMQVPTYLLISATINTFEQYKSVEMDLNYELVELASNTIVFEKTFRESSEWKNIYSTWSGDERARYGTCEDFGNYWKPFPLEEDLFLETVEKIRWLFLEELEEDLTFN